jgi:mannitol operon transcriptional antiterminator
MVALTVQQKNILRSLLAADGPVAMAALAGQTKLTPRQVNYRLKAVKTWLDQRDAILKSTPGVGLKVTCSLTQRQKLLRELTTQADLYLVLTAGQRQQLLALALLTTTEPLILNNLQYISAASRTTVLKDLDPIQAWGLTFGLALIRKPNYGILFDGPESGRRQARAGVRWGDTPFKESLLAMTFGAGLNFSLADNRTLPIVQQTNRWLAGLNTQTAFEWVAFAEAQLGGRFTDEAVLHLALALAVQAQRARNGRYLHVDAATLHWLTVQKVWPVAAEVLQLMETNLPQHSMPAEIAGIAMHLLSGLRDHLWPGDLEIDPALTGLIDMLIGEVARAFSTSGLRHDTSLRDGLVSHIIPAVLRQRFGLWSPPRWSDGAIASQWQQEYRIAGELARLVTEQTGVVLPNSEIDTLALLLRAAFVRERPNQPRRAYVICPSGMATAQLLLARLKARFPGLEIMGVLSMRELSTERVAGAQLLISTVPLESPRRSLPVIQVHPLLTAADIEAITNWLTSTAGR